MKRVKWRGKTNIIESTFTEIAAVKSVWVMNTDLNEKDRLSTFRSWREDSLRRPAKATDYQVKNRSREVEENFISSSILDDKLVYLWIIILITHENEKESNDIRGGKSNVLFKLSCKNLLMIAIWNLLFKTKKKSTVSTKLLIRCTLMES